jgi:hypothetical protein
VSVFEALTTCNTEPAGKLAVDALVNTVPELSGKLSVRSVEVPAGVVIVKVAVPVAGPDNEILLMLDLSMLQFLLPVRPLWR